MQQGDSLRRNVEVLKEAAPKRHAAYKELLEDINSSSENMSKIEMEIESIAANSTLRPRHKRGR